jgi:hypothetical protein
MAQKKLTIDQNYGRTEVIEYGFVYVAGAHALLLSEMPRRGAHL